VEVKLQTDILMGAVIGVLAWIYARREGINCGAFVRGSLRAAAALLLLGVLGAIFVERSIAQEFMARKSVVGLSLVLFVGACTLGILNIFLPTSDDDI